jgi:DNA invertase Pin-like site-specific DNA recombinase
MIATYLRVSSDKQDEAMQRTAIAHWVSAYLSQHPNEGHIIVEFMDYDISGTITARPGYQSLLEGIMNGTIKIIVVYEYSRLWRDLEEQSRVTKLIPILVIELVSVTEGQLKTAEDRFKANILGSANVYEVERLTRRIKDGIARKKQDIVDGKDVWKGRGKDKKMRKRPIKK